MSFSRNKFLILTCCILLVTFLSGCATTSSDEKWKPVARHDSNKVHIVKWHDETLPAIASWYTGFSDNLEAIANANPTLSPDKIHVGDQVFIPQDLLKTRAEMSRDFLNTFLSSSVVTIKTSSGVASPKTPRIIAPAPYKEKKDMRGEGASLSPQKPKPTITPEPLPDTNPVSSPQKKQGLHLFGPK